jgi:hypothetical protein
MVDRTDIDALLIGALYGELTPADEARLSSHLESHPADRSALAGLRHAREAVRDSRILEVLLEPPQAVSALLLQEAHRRAPRATGEGGEGWFARLARSFLAHPAMAAATMLVLVLGVAGTLYMRNGASELDTRTAPEVATAAPTAAAPARTATVDNAASAPAGIPPVVEPTTPEAGSAMSVGLADKPVVVPPSSPTRRDAAKHEAKQVAKPSAPKPEKLLEVQTKQAAPKELDDREQQIISGQLATNAPAGKVAAPQGFATAGRSQGGGGAAAPAAPPPPPSQAQAIASPAATEASDELGKDKKDDLLAWAKAQHDLARSYTSKGDCVRAGQIATQVSARAPDYFAQYMQDDRALKSCRAYIDDARDKDAEKAAKSRAHKSVNSYEPTRAK